MTWQFLVYILVSLHNLIYRERKRNYRNTLLSVEWSIYS